MRNLFLTTAVFSFAALGTGVAAAQPSEVAGTYDVKYEEVANNCTNVGMALGRGTLKITKTGATVSVDIERIPVMSGAVNKTKIKVASKPGPTSIAGLDGKFSLAGAVVESTVSFVFVAEYFSQNKALCTQSWNISGVRK